MKPIRKYVDACNPLLPGYTGYIPQRCDRVGTSYGNDSFVCMTSMYNAVQRNNDKKDELRYIAATTPRLPPICCNEDVLQALYEYNYKHHPYMLGTEETKRSLLEPPIPGWTGFVPRAKVTDLGDGVRYHEMAKNCYQDFKNIIDQVTCDPSSKINKGEKPNVEVSHIPKVYHRSYRPEGMIPKYTGHVPHQHLIVGKTYGNLCRSCSACSHKEACYGTYLTKKHRAEWKHQKNRECDVKS
ncbi:PREDICTED: uncharacterized protein C10orf82 homolog [Gavialis gangeticus]|uniref:uncharacterized protein C10orf82 homolog n=1 Tax=Gavialis gangeticus TaxID=94835 RepID=UPI00092F0AEA|nr:PREDICTED: uncharacterized protein C10orf82 homolog [Gavialis gangeticus]